MCMLQPHSLVCLTSIWTNAEVTIEDTVAFHGITVLHLLHLYNTYILHLQSPIVSRLYNAHLSSRPAQLEDVLAPEI